MEPYSKKDIEHLVSLSRHLGSDPRKVQGGGGNVSIKDDKTMLVKASGQLFESLSYPDGFVALDHHGLASALNASYLSGSALDDPAYNDVLKKCAIEQSGAKPSIETALHALLGRAVVHTHPNAVLRMVCHESAGDILKPCLDGLAADWLLVPYANPGTPLAYAMQHAAQVAGVSLQSSPLLVFLANHGLITVGDRVEEAFSLTDHVISQLPALPRYNRQTPDQPALELSAFLDSRTRSVGQWFSVALGLPDDWETLFMSDEARPWLGVLFPDQAVYCGPAVLKLDGDDRNRWERDLSGFVRYWDTEPKVIMHRDGEILIHADSIQILTIRRDVLAAVIDTITLQGQGLQYLSEGDVRYLLGWDSEKYRQQILAEKGKP